MTASEYAREYVVGGNWTQDEIAPTAAEGLADEDRERIEGDKTRPANLTAAACAEAVVEYCRRHVVHLAVRWDASSDPTKPGWVAALKNEDGSFASAREWQPVDAPGDADDEDLIGAAHDTARFEGWHESEVRIDRDGSSGPVMISCDNSEQYATVELAEKGAAEWAKFVLADPFGVGFESRENALCSTVEFLWSVWTENRSIGPRYVNMKKSMTLGELAGEEVGDVDEGDNDEVTA
jgi:hypothetical protein